jgi:hypothetical protein
VCLAPAGVACVSRCGAAVSFFCFVLCRCRAASSAAFAIVAIAVAVAVAVVVAVALRCCRPSPRPLVAIPPPPPPPLLRHIATAVSVSVARGVSSHHLPTERRLSRDPPPRDTRRSLCRRRCVSFSFFGFSVAGATAATASATRGGPAACRTRRVSCRVGGLLPSAVFCVCRVCRALCLVASVRVASVCAASVCVAAVIALIPPPPSPPTTAAAAAAAPPPPPPPPPPWPNVSGSWQRQRRGATVGEGDRGGGDLRHGPRPLLTGGEGASVEAPPLEHPIRCIVHRCEGLRDYNGPPRGDINVKAK